MKRSIFTLAILSVSLLASGSAFADKAALEAAKKAKDIARATAEAIVHYGKTCPAGFTLTTPGGKAACSFDTAVSVPLTCEGVANGMIELNIVPGKRDICTKPNTLVGADYDTNAITKDKKGVVWDFPKVDPAAVETAERQLEAAFSTGSLVPIRPKNLKNAAAFRGDTLTVPRLSAERDAVLIGVDSAPTEIADGTDSTKIRFRVFTAMINVSP